MDRQVANETGSSNNNKNNNNTNKGSRNHRSGYTAPVYTIDDIESQNLSVNLRKTDLMYEITTDQAFL